MFSYILALHIIFVVTWFSGLFYIVRLFIYNREAYDKHSEEGKILQKQYRVMIRRLWYGITWPSAILTLIFGTWMFVLYVHGNVPLWLWIKLIFVLGLFAYHWSLQYIFKQQMQGKFHYSSHQLRIWNEVATLFLIAIVFLVVLKNSLNMIKGFVGLLALGGLLMIAIRLYKKVRERKGK